MILITNKQTHLVLERLGFHLAGSSQSTIVSSPMRFSTTPNLCQTTISVVAMLGVERRVPRFQAGIDNEPACQYMMMLSNATTEVYVSYTTARNILIDSMTDAKN